MSEAGAGERGNRGARRITLAVAVCLIALLGLAWWVFLIPYESSDLAGAHSSMDCETKVDWDVDPEGERQMAEFERSCDEARSSRRTTALVIGGVVATVAFAASTWPSRRLTGEELGPIR